MALGIEPGSRERWAGTLPLRDTFSPKMELFNEEDEPGHEGSRLQQLPKYLGSAAAPEPVRARRQG